MENDILDSLNDLGYQGPLTDEDAFAKALEGGAKSLEFTKLVHILAAELKTLCRLEEAVSIMNDPDESSSFLLELSSFLKELGCPYKCLVTGHMSSRLQNRDDCLLLLDYMISELMAARMVCVDCPKDKQSAALEIVMQESPTAKDLKEILIALKFNKPPPNITAEMLFTKLEAKIKETIQKEGDKLVGKPLYNKALSEKDWKNLETTYSEMYEEYRLRRETLITRLECTIQSFEWSDRLKGKKDVIQTAYRPKRDSLKVKPNVKISDFLAARTSLLLVEKTSSASVRKNTQSDVNKVIIGQVPDRGGRPNEQQPPPPEMPSWQQRSAPQGGGGRGGMDGGRGEEEGGECKEDTARPPGRIHRGPKLAQPHLHRTNNVITKRTKSRRAVTATKTTAVTTTGVAVTITVAAVTTTEEVTITAEVTIEEDIIKATAAEAVINRATIVRAAIIRDIAKAAAVAVITKVTNLKTTRANKDTRVRLRATKEGGTRTNTTTATEGAGAEVIGGDVDRH